MKMDTGVAIALISAGGTAAVGVYAARSSKKAAVRAAENARQAADRAAEVELRKVDQTAYNNALAYYEKTLKLVSGQLEKVTVQVDRLSAQLADEKDSSNKLRDQVWTLERQLRELSSTVEDRSRSPLAPKPI